ncbi:MAG: helix-turn-helix transcriptional regulator [Rikenellaceae bacterium]
MSSKINYITGRTSEFSEFREGIPVDLSQGGFFICTSGVGDVMINAKQFSIKPWDLLVALPGSYVYALRTSEDFDGVIFGVDLEILLGVELANKGFYISSVTENPCISLTETDAKKILLLREHFLENCANEKHPMRDEINDALLKIMIYEVAAFYASGQTNQEQKCSRDEAIFSNFMVHLHSEKTYNRSLEYYAQKQSITPSHLSRVVKRMSSHSASEWVSMYVISCIKRLLQRRELPIATIAEMMGMANASFLSQYFRKYTSMTPREYRSQYFLN